jgi:small subunit ribosomal protein S2
LYVAAVADACLEGSKSASSVPNKDEYVAAEGAAE